MKTAFNILKRDLLALLKNPIALLVVGALLVLPGLYAWYCIVANWDPYSNTGAMPVAIVNEDAGAMSDFAGEVNIGEQVVQKLEDNDQLDWRVYESEEQALEDTRLCTVYATIVLPEDLSQNLIGIFEGSKNEPAIYYYPNEKYNAVATKVTDSAAQTLVQQINQGFSSTVNQKILESTQKVADGVEGRAHQANQSAVAEVRAIQGDLDKVIASIDDAMSSIEGWRKAAKGANAALAKTAEQLPTIRQRLADGSAQLDDLRKKTSSFENGLSKTILDSTGTVSNLSGQAATNIAEAVQDLKTVKTELDALREAAAGDFELYFVVAGLDGVAGTIESLLQDVDDRVSNINESVQQATANATEATGRISGEVMPKLDSGAFSLSISFSKLGGAIGQFEPQIDQLRNVLSKSDGALDEATSALTDAKSLLATISANLKGTVADIGTIGRALEVDKLTELLSIEPGNVGEFISSPVRIVTEKVYPVSNYGTAVAPFYTNLALWIGCFILVSLMKVEVSGESARGATRRERYFGRWLLFVILSLLQSQVICGVDILLGIDCANPALFMLVGAVCSFAYMNLIYALVKTFRNVGKTLCIFLLIMQVPGSSGMYPIEMMPGFFRFIHPALPFTYGIDAMREALCGMHGLAYVGDVCMMLLIAPVSIMMGLGLRPAMGNILAMFDEEMNKVGFFASEVSQGREEGRILGMMRAVAAHADYADEVEERAWRFNRKYKRWRRLGSVVAFAIPFAFLVLVLPFNLMMPLSTDVKLAALITMLLVLALVMLGLVVLEYMHRIIAEEARALGASIANEAGLDLLAADGSDTPPGMFRAVGAANAKGRHARTSGGGPARDIFATDLRLGFRSAVGVVVILLLVVTPSMYAWFNIAGSWDPYSATGNLKVAVANEDDGYKGELIPVTINVGDTVVTHLQGNSSFDWVFVDKDEAISGVEGSKYYAAIVIPDDFSSNMMTYLTDDASYPDVVYYTNEKENPIAPIITQKGASSIQENIRQSFTERVDQVALSVGYDVLNYVTDDKVEGYVAKMGGHLDDATHDAKSAAREMKMLGGLMGTLSDIVDTTGAAIDGLKEAGKTAKGAVADAKSGGADAMAAFDEAISVTRDVLDGRSIDIDEVQAKIDAILDLIAGGAEIVPVGIQDAIDTLGEYKSEYAAADPADVESADAAADPAADTASGSATEPAADPSSDSSASSADASETDPAADPTADQAEEPSAEPSIDGAFFDAAIEALQQAKDHAEGAPSRVGNARGKIDELVQKAKDEVSAARAYFDDTVDPSASKLRSTVGDISSSTSEVVGGIEEAVEGFGDSTGGLSNQLTGLSGGLANASDKLTTAATNIEDMKARLAKALKSGDVKQVEAVILGGDPEVMAASLAAPVRTQREPVYSVANYGSAMAPFYTVLSLWVGALVMISTMRVHVVEERIEELRRRYGRVRPRHEFFGRYGIFGLIGLLQSSLVLLGDLLLLHIECASPVLFFVFGVFIGQVFCLIVYTITELFGDVGKALCVILLIMQVAASGGTFPVQMLDPILLSVASYLPFYYAMSLLQECVAGIMWSGVLVDAGALLAMAGAMLVIGLPLRRPFRKLNDFFEEQLEKTGYM